MSEKIIKTTDEIEVIKMEPVNSGGEIVNESCNVFNNIEKITAINEERTKVMEKTEILKSEAIEIKDIEQKEENIVLINENICQERQQPVNAKIDIESPTKSQNVSQNLSPAKSQTVSPTKSPDVSSKKSNEAINSIAVNDNAFIELFVEKEKKSIENNIISHVECLAQRERQRLSFEQQLEQLKSTLLQKDNMIALQQRENALQDKEKEAFRRDKVLANKEKESAVIKFAMKEKLLIDAKKEKETVEKQLADAKKEIKNVSTRFQAVNEEKSRITYMLDEKCNELNKCLREAQKLKTDYSHLESKLKYHVNKLNLETEAKLALEKKLEEERNAPNKMEEKANEKLKMEFEANTILLKHEISRKTELLDTLTKEHNKSIELIKQLQEQLNKETAEKQQLAISLSKLEDEHNTVQNCYSDEMLNSAKLRGQLEELQVLKTQNTFNEEKILQLNATVKEFEEKLEDNASDLKELHIREQELLSFNKEMTESIVKLQNEICLMNAKVQATEAENNILIKEKNEYDSKYEALETSLKACEEQKNEERQLLAKHLSEKTKLYEMTQMKLDNMQGDYEATKIKHSTVVKELQREIQKYKKAIDQNTIANPIQNKEGASSHTNYCINCNQNIANNSALRDVASVRRSHSRNSSQGSICSRQPSESSESETVVSNATAVQNDLQGPSKKHLVDRILRLQQASARQTEKIDFLENHTLSLVAELQKKSKVVQYYMMRDEAGALTSSKSDQNKWELAKYGNGVMSAIYNGIKGENKSMTLDLSLEINKKLQAVLEDTLLKNITLKENLDVLGLEVDNLTRKLRQVEMAKE